MRAKEIYNDGKTFAIITQLCDGEELIDELIRKQKLPETHAAKLIY